MPDSAQGRSSGGGRCLAERDSSPFWYPHLCDFTSYLRDYGVYFDTVRFSKIPSAKAVQVMPFVTGVCDTTAGTWLKRWKHREGLIALNLQAAYQVLNSSFVRCREKDGYQKRLTTLLPEVLVVQRCRVSSLLIY